jgi:FAD/FMN-containing dehydrogenase
MSATSPPPMSAHELQESVRQGRPADPSRLSRILRLDSRRALLEVQAHARWHAVAEHLRPGDTSARALLAARATVGATLAWNGAGPDGRPAVAHVESLTMVTPDGHLRRVDRLTSGGLFALTLGGHGLFGAMYSATLRIESLLRAIQEPQPPERLSPGVPRAAARRLRLLLPPEAVESFVAEARERCGEWRAEVASVQARRMLDEDETFLRWAQRRYAQVTLWLEERATLGGAVRCTQLRRELIDAAIARGGTFPIACTPEATRAQTEACYPQLPAFLAEQRRIDPGGLMANAWLRHQRSLLSLEPCEVRWG